MAYIPGISAPINSLEELRKYVEDELRAISQSQTEMQEVELRPRSTAPTKPREGMLVFANGTNWNPGSGAGTYEYRGGAWVKL